MSGVRIAPALARDLAEVALSCALNPIHGMGPREKAETLIRVADTHPQLIEAEIAKRQREIALLRDFLPKLSAPIQHGDGG